MTMLQTFQAAVLTSALVLGTSTYAAGNTMTQGKGTQAVRRKGTT
ncbi:MAG: hypothetical protein ACLPJW_09640 [Rhodomicrobium sp.]